VISGFGGSTELHKLIGRDDTASSDGNINNGTIRLRTVGDSNPCTIPCLGL